MPGDGMIREALCIKLSLVGVVISLEVCGDLLGTNVVPYTIYLDIKLGGRYENIYVLESVPMFGFGMYSSNL